MVAENQSQPTPTQLRPAAPAMIIWVALTAGLFAGFEEYKNLVDPFNYWFDLDLSMFDRVIIFWTLWAKTILLASVPLAVGLLLVALGRVRLGWIFVVTFVALLFTWMSLDGRVYRVTGVHLADYAQNLAANDALQWVGGLRTSSALLIGPLTIGILLSLCMALGISDRITAAQRTWPWISNRKTTLVLAFLVFIACVGLIPAQRRASSYRVVLTLQSMLPIDFPFLDSSRLLPQALADFRKQFDAKAASVGERTRSQVAQPAGVETGIGQAVRRPNIVVLVLESFRYEAVEEMMPRLDVFAKKGLRANRHYATSNRSQFGLFALLYGHSGLTYDATVEAQVPPQLCVSLAELGYQRHYISGAAVDWAGMNEFLNESNFDSVAIDLEDDWPERDQRVLKKIATTLAEATTPQFVLGFLMSTHYNYRYPKEYERHMPVVSELTGNVRDAAHLIEHREAILNRYRNAAGFLDDQLDSFLSQIDLSNTIVVVTGDHGESIFDDGVLSHSSRLSEIQTRVPMLIVGSGISEKNIEQATSHMDLVPTLLHVLTGNPSPLEQASGRSLLLDRPEDRVLLFQVTSRSSPVELLLIDGEQRLRIDLRRDGALRAVGFIDKQTQLQDVGSGDAEQWVQCLDEELLKILGGPHAEPH